MAGWAVQLGEEHNQRSTPLLKSSRSTLCREPDAPQRNRLTAQCQAEGIRWVHKDAKTLCTQRQMVPLRARMDCGCQCVAAECTEGASQHSIPAQKVLFHTAQIRHKEQVIEHMPRPCELRSTFTVPQMVCVMIFCCVRKLTELNLLWEKLPATHRQSADN